MTVSKISKNKIKIALSDSEVLSYFGSYEKIASMSKGIRLTISSLLQDSLRDYGFTSGDDKFLIELNAQENSGCEILITIITKKELVKRTSSEIYMLEFSDTESMTGGVMYLYRNRKYKHIPSSLYKMTNTYRLIVTIAGKKDFPFAINEFCLRQSDSPFETAYTEEYGKVLIPENAVEKFGDAFSKSF